MSWKEKLAGKVNARLAVYLLAVPITLFYILVLAGCISTSPGIPSIYLIAIKSANGTSGPAADLSVRVGYFGMCASTSKILSCASTVGQSATQLASSFLSTSDTTTTSIFSLATTLQSQGFLLLLAIAGSIFSISLLSILILDRDLKRSDPSPKADKRRRLLTKASKSLVWTSVALAMAASVGTHQTAAALQCLSGMVKEVVIGDGMALLTLQWLITAFSVAFAFGIGAVCGQGGGSSGDASPEGSSFGGRKGG